MSNDWKPVLLEDAMRTSIENERKVIVQKRWITALICLNCIQAILWVIRLAGE